MPPKNKSSQPNKKIVEKKKEKIVEDKTFGIKNKKGAKQQRYIQQIQHANTNKSEDVKKLEKDKKIKEQKEMNNLFRPVATQKVEKGTDPKSVLCAFFKQGQCGKGDKCKFSHDLNLDRKAEKRSMYVDMRDESEETMEYWDEKKLKEVVERKHGETEKKMPTTTIICKYFIEALEKKQYGWFWACPNGTNCIYRHALPPGFALKNGCNVVTNEEISLEDLIERERNALAGNFTKITLETFLAWKMRKLKEKKQTAHQMEEKKRSDFNAGRHIGLSGRDMFYFNPALATADELEEGDAAVDFYSMKRNEESDYREIQVDIIEREAQEVDGTGTQAAADRLKYEQQLTCAEGGIIGNDIEIDEDLFMTEDDELEGMINDLDLDD